MQKLLTYLNNRDNYLLTRNTVLFFESALFLTGTLPQVLHFEVWSDKSKFKMCGRVSVRNKGGVVSAIGQSNAVKVSSPLNLYLF